MEPYPPDPVEGGLKCRLHKHNTIVVYLISLGGSLLYTIVNQNSSLSPSEGGQWEIFDVLMNPWV